MAHSVRGLGHPGLIQGLQGYAYVKGAYTVVYPVVRGTGPLFTVFGAYLIFSETL